MRLNLIIFFLTGMLMQVSAVSTAQITLSERKTPLLAVIKSLKKQSGYHFFYNDQNLKEARPVTVSLKNVSLEEALKACMEGQELTFKIKEKMVVIKPKPKSLLDKVIGKFLLLDVKGVVRDEKGEALAGATVRVKGTDKVVMTGSKGEFVLVGVEENAVLVISYLGFESRELKAKKDMGEIAMVLASGKLEEVSVIVNTGFQSLPKERAVGSFEVIDNELLNRSVSTNILDRLNGVTTGITFENHRALTNRISTNPNQRYIGLTLRGESTFLSSTDPLIVVDNFPFEGELSSINPNDIENVTILRDASAASIWGARSANGVIIITTKKGKKNEKMKVDLVSNFSFSDRPNLFHSQQFLDSKSFIEVEQFLFDNGYFNSDISNTTSRPLVSPSVEIMNLVKTETISEAEGQIRLNELSQYDIRNDMKKYVYQKEVRQQYSLALNGGTKDITYRLSAGFDKNRDRLVNNGFDRVTLNSLNTYSPMKNLEVTTGINYSQSNTALNNEFEAYTVSNGKYLGNYFPYTRLADDVGNPLNVPLNFRESYLTLTEQRGYQDWRYRPIDELNLADNNTKVNSILARISASYKIIPSLTATINYQTEQQKINRRNHQSTDTYYVRNLFNRFTSFNSMTNLLTRNFPEGGVLELTNYDWRSTNFRSQLNYDTQLGKNTIVALAGFEARELKTEGGSQSLIGYDDQFGTSNMNLDYVTAFPISPNSTSRLPGPGGRIFGITNRFMSYFANASYTFDDKYTVTGSARTDGANLFGTRTNNKFTPLWSIGAGWKISNESFYSSSIFPYLNLRASYGFNGNTYSYGTALLTGRYSTELITGAQRIASLTAPNSELRWERVKNVNFGLDFGIKNNIVKGSIEYYNKAGIDLIQPTELAPQTGFLNYSANTAKTKTRGLDLQLTANPIDNVIKWNSTVLFSIIKDEVVKYDAPYTSLFTPGGIVGKPLNALFAYRWEGLNPENGNPRGHNNGNVSEDYLSIYNNLEESAIVYGGSMTPTRFGSFRNDLSFKNISFSFNIQLYFNYVFRRPTVSTNYTTILTADGSHSDYNKRWQNPGDEQFTTVPSLSYPENQGRDFFYRMSEIQITRGDHIRLQDLRLGYDLNDLLQLKSTKISTFLYANNLGVIWRKNKFDIDPNTMNGSRAFPEPRTISFGINAKL